VDAALEAAMAAVRTLANLGRAAREAAGGDARTVRQPLPRMVCVVPDVPDTAVRPLVPLLAAELNVRQVEFATSADAFVRLEAKPNFRTLGKKFGRATKVAAEAVRALTTEQLRAFERGEALAVTVEGETRTLDSEDLEILRRASGPLVVQEAGGYFAAIDPTITPELRREGVAREVISRVQRLRKEAGLAVSDRIVLALDGDDEIVEAVRTHRDRVAAEVLARDVVFGINDAGAYQALQTVDLDGPSVRIALTRTQ
jgi:isoleucyl-tRNA synthetase